VCRCVSARVCNGACVRDRQAVRNCVKERAGERASETAHGFSCVCTRACDDACVSGRKTFRRVRARERGYHILLRLLMVSRGLEVWSLRVLVGLFLFSSVLGQPAVWPDLLRGWGRGLGLESRCPWTTLLSS